MSRIFSVRNFLGFIIFLATLVTLGLAGLVAGRHLKAQWESRPDRETALLAPADEPAQEGLTLERIERIGLGLYLQWQREFVEKPASSSDEVRPFTIAPGETADDVANRLKQEGFVTDAELFKTYMRYYGIDRHLAAGNFDLSPSMTMQQIAEQLQRARVDEIAITIPEGWRVEQIADMLTQQNITDGRRFLELVKNGDPSAAGLGPYVFLAGRPQGSSLEGYLFPDTYRLPANATAEDLLRRMLDNFATKVTPEIIQEAQASGLSLHNLITLASIIEREAVRADERPVIASVYLNRISDVCTSEVGGRYLQADPTVQYARGVPGNWWWQPASVEEYKKVDSPYNTYLYTGLPPGPISNPGLSAILAAVRPQPTSYCFFVATGDGGHIFAQTLAEHEINVARYQR
jgi:UPF0755 protein